MTLLKKKFWSGFLLGSGIFLALGIFGINMAFKISYIDRSLSINDTSQPHAISLLRSGEPDRLERHLHHLALSDVKTKQFYQCMADKWWFLTQTKSGKNCYRLAAIKMADDWSPQDSEAH